jgi:hypothetical protein
MISLPEEVLPFEMVRIGSASFAGGNGTASNPYQISNVSQLQNMSANLSAHYVLINDINASETKDWNWNGSAYNGFDPIDGDYYHPFNGSINGGGFKIIKLFIKRPSDYEVGLFKFVMNSRIQDISLIDVNITGKNYVGGLVARAGSTSFFNCSISGNISGENNVGGLIGASQYDKEEIIFNCSSDCNINGYRTIGGLIGSSSITIEKCHSSGSVIITDCNAGGLVGGSSSRIQNCTYSGTVTGNDYIGGIVGISSGDLKNCTFHGNVSGRMYVGGLIGKEGSVNDYDSTITFCRSSGNISGNDRFCGGLIGSNYGDVSNCTFQGNITGMAKEMGGLIGSCYKTTIKNCSSSGNIHSTNHIIGGVIGDLGYYTSIEHSSFSGDVSGDSIVGGFVGTNSQSEISNCSTRGNVSGMKNNIGGFVGENIGPIKNCYSSANISGNGTNIVFHA